MGEGWEEDRWVPGFGCWKGAPEEEKAAIGAAEDGTCSGVENIPVTFVEVFNFVATEGENGEGSAIRP